MPRDLVRVPPLRPSFLTFEKDVETILRKLFIESQPYSNDLKKLLYISASDVLDKSYTEEMSKVSLATLIKEEYIMLRPKISQEEFEVEKSNILISFDKFMKSPINPEFRSCSVYFDILCNFKNWDLGNYRIRPLKIAGLIDSILDNSRLSGIGTFQFMHCNETLYDEHVGGYTLAFRAVYGEEDSIPRAEVI